MFPSLSVQENLEMGGYVSAGAATRASRPRLRAFRCSAPSAAMPHAPCPAASGRYWRWQWRLIVEPRVLLLDEPSAGLSPLAAERLFDAIAEINRQGLSIGMVEQNASEALELSHRAYILVDGTQQPDRGRKALAADPDIRRLFLGG